MLPPASRVARQKLVEFMWCKGRLTKNRSLLVILNHSFIAFAFAVKFVKLNCAPFGDPVVPDVNKISA